GVPGDATRVLELCEIARRSSDAGDFDLAHNLLLGAALRCWWADAGPDAPRAVVAAADTLPSNPSEPVRLAIAAVAEPIARATTVARSLAAVAPDSLDDAIAMHTLG